MPSLVTPSLLVPSPARPLPDGPGPVRSGPARSGPARSRPVRSGTAFRPGTRLLRQGVAGVLVAFAFSAPTAAQTSYTLGTLANRAEELPAVGELAAQSRALGAQQRRYVGDYGLQLDGNATFYPGYVSSDPASARAAAYAGSIDLVWNLLDGGLAESLYERRRLDGLQNQTGTSLRNAREDARTAVRRLALTMLQSQQRAEGAREAAALADTVETRYATLFESRDVLRSTFLDARLRQRRYAEEARRYDELALRIRDELARQLRIDPDFRVEVPQGLPQFDAADLDYAARAAARRNTNAFTAPMPAFDDLRLALFAGVATRQRYIAVDDDRPAFTTGPRFGARASVPLSVVGRFASARRERGALIEQQEAQYDATLRVQLARVNDALDQYRRAETRYAELLTSVSIAEATLEEARLLAAEGVRLTPNEVLLLEARIREDQAESEAQRLETWKQFYILQQLAGQP